MNTKTSISKKDLTKDILKVFKETNNTTRENYLKYGKYSRAPIKRIYGTWNNLLTELGYKINMHKGTITREDVIEDMQKLIKEYDFVNSRIQRKYGAYSQKTIDNIFGSYTELAKIMGLKVDGRQVSDQEIKDDLINLYQIHGYMSQQLIKEYGIVSNVTVINRFKSLQIICDTLDIPLYTNSPMSKFSCFVIGVISSELNEEPKYEYTFPWLINPKTGFNLRIDAYYPGHNLVLEADGKQHFSDGKSFYTTTPEELKVYQERDKLKDKLLKQHNIQVLRISYKDKLDDIKRKVKPFIK